MDPMPGCSYAQREEETTSSEEINSKIESMTNLEDTFHIQHGFFRWSVENFSVFPTDSGISCYSPTFVLKETWWYIAFCPKAEDGVGDSISLKLVRHKSDPGPRSVGVSYTLGLESSLNKIWFRTVENLVFAKGRQDGLVTSVLGSLENFLTHDDNRNSFSLVCEIYVVYISNRTKKLPRKASQIDSSLSQNFIALFESQRKVDVLIEIRNCSLWAHKSILCARSRTLARLLESGKFFIQLSCSAPCLRCVIFYMYSGSFDYLARYATFSIGLYELACELSLDNLRDVLTPHKMETTSRVQVKSFRRTCTIDGFDLVQLTRKSIHTPVVFDETSGIGVKLELCEFVSPFHFVRINVELRGVSRAFHSTLNISLLNKNCVPSREVPVGIIDEAPAELKNSVLSLAFTFSASDVQSSITDGNLFINVECTKYSLRHRSDLPASLDSLSNDCQNWIEELSANMKKLLQTGKLSDITLRVKESKFKVHRSILAARSHFFQSFLCVNNYIGNIININDIEPRILWLILTYMYCGTISHVRDLSIDDFLKMHEASIKCKLQSLTELCAVFLGL